MPNAPDRNGSAPNEASLHESSSTRQTFLYFGALTLFIYMATPAGYLVDIQTSYMLKNQLHATATEISRFRLITAIPIYFAFIFGLIRDQWNPFGMRDRGFFLIFAPATVVAFIWMANARLSYSGLLVGMLLLMVLSRFIAAAYQGLIALVGQEKLMSGRLAVLWNVVSSVPVLAGALASGFISRHLPPNQTFVIAAVLTAFLAVFALWKPAAVFSHAYERPQAATTNFVGNVKRLLHHRAVYPAVLICFLWNFAPGADTPLQFYLADRLHATDDIYSYYKGIFAISFTPTFLLYGYLCKRVPLKKLLWWGTVG